MRLLFLLALTLGLVARGVAAEPVPLPKAHAHNDYMHAHPLADALEHGLCSVEADIFLVDGKLLVAHELRKTSPERTLQALYLDPLRERIRKNGGRVYPNGPQCTLLIDLKTDWKALYPALRKVLEQYSDILTTFTGGEVKTNALLAIITGDRSLRMFAGEKVRYAAYDGSLAELESSEPATLVPWISTSWYASFKWNGRGPIPAEDRSKLRQVVTRAHEHGRKVRFWGGPDQPEFWTELLADGVDLINTDDLAGVQRFFAAHP